MIEEKKDWWMHSLEDWIDTFPGKGYCHCCKKKLSLLGTKVVYTPFGFTYRLCQDCYRERKQFLKEHKQSQIQLQK